jgi:hypothetical protein
LDEDFQVRFNRLSRAEDKLERYSTRGAYGVPARIAARLHRVLDRTCQRWSVSILYHQTVGIKCLNQLITSDLFEAYAVRAIPEIAGDELLIGFDGLSDEYTLLNTPISESPHLSLMMALENGESLNASEYVRRTRAGILDFRAAHEAGPLFLETVMDRFQSIRKKVEEGQHKPIKVLRIDRSMYIADGKHRAAICRMLGIRPMVIDVTPVLFDSFFWWVRRKMLEKPERFRTHLNFFERLCISHLITAPQ